MTQNTYLPFQSYLQPNMHFILKNKNITQITETLASNSYEIPYFQNVIVDSTLLHQHLLITLVNKDFVP